MENDLTSLLVKLESESWQIRLTATEAIGRLREVERLSGLRISQKDPNEFVRSAAVTAMGQVRGEDEANQVIEPLCHALKDEDAGVRKAASWSIGRIAPENDDVVTALFGLFADEDEEVRKSAAWSLGRISISVDRLLAALKDDNSRVRSGAASALGNMVPLAKKIAPVLAGCLKDPDAQVRVNTAESLLAFGPDAVQVISELSEALKDENRDVAWKASETLRKIGTEEAMSAWSRYRGSPQTAIDELLKQVKSKDRNARVNAIKTLGKNKAQEAVEVLIEALSDEYSVARAAAATSLRKIGSAEAEQALEAYYSEEEEE